MSGSSNLGRIAALARAIFAGSVLAVAIWCTHPTSIKSWTAGRVKFLLVLASPALLVFALTRSRKYWRLMVLFGLGIPSVLLLWSLSNILFVARKADQHASGKPYCIQVADGGLGKYRAVSSKRDLAGLRMWTPFTSGGGSSDFQFAFHAVLVVSDASNMRLENWSYSKYDFLPISENARKALYLRPACAPEYGFLDKL